MASALVAAPGFVRTSNGFVGTSDGWTDLAADRRSTSTTTRRRTATCCRPARSPLDGDDDVHARARLRRLRPRPPSATARASLGAGVRRPRRGLRGRVARLPGSASRPAPAALTGGLLTQYNVALMTVKAHEDKTYRGAFIASLTLPWGFAVNADEGGGGYHFVWARDLYQQVTCAAGRRRPRRRRPRRDVAVHAPAAGRRDVPAELARGRLARPAQHPARRDRVPDRPGLAARAHRRRDLGRRAQGRGRARARGPATPQERWEETGGYSPLDAAGDDRRAGRRRRPRPPARRHGPRARCGWASPTSGSAAPRSGCSPPTARSATAATTSASTTTATPTTASARDFGNAAGVHKENARRRRRLPRARAPRRQGARRPVRRRLARRDRRVAGHRHAERAGLAPLHLRRLRREGRRLAVGRSTRRAPRAARGRCSAASAASTRSPTAATGCRYLQTMANTANDGYMIPEQVWDEPSPRPRRTATSPARRPARPSPLAWAMAQYVRLARAIAAGQPGRDARGRAATATPPAPPARCPALATSPRPRRLGRRPRARSPSRGTTDAAQVYVGVNGDASRHASRRAAARSAPPSTLAARPQPDHGRRRGRRRRHQHAAGRPSLSFGTRVGGLTDPAGDDNGPGTYVYPTNSAFAPGGFDLTGARRLHRRRRRVFVATIAGEVVNPWGGDQISHQRFNVYLGDGPATAAHRPARHQHGHGRRGGTSPSSATAASTAPGVYAPDGDRTVADGEHARRARDPPDRRRRARARRSAGSTSQPRATASRCSATPRRARASATSGPSTIRLLERPDPASAGFKEYRFGGGAGVSGPSCRARTPTPATPTRIDVIVGAGQTQADVLDWQAASPVRLPMEPLGD